ncbi:hypothetical protein [Delftia tsuruhatensis]|uniref:hypothetical protein n=1 Tax=Delftia tsuruhatensis TaxID=180282 RepID=UPI0031D2338D
MTAISHQKIHKLCDEIEALLADAMPKADAMRYQRIAFVANELKGLDPYITRKADRLVSRAGIYLSARRHQSEQGGAEAVMREMRYSLLSAIRSQANVLQTGME